MPHWTNQYSYMFGAPLERELGVFALIADEDAEAKVDLAVPILWKAAQWIRSTVVTVDLSVCGVSIVQVPLRQGAYLGLTGHAFFWGAGDAHEEYIQTPSGSPEDIGMMRGIRAIEGKAYAVGMQRQVYRRDDLDRWVDLSPAIRPDPSSGIVCSFEAIDGFSAAELYACGRDGEIWWYDRGNWRQVASPTNMHLTNLVCAGDGNVYACGRVGVLLKGRHDRWEIIPQDLVAQDFWGIAWFGDRLYLATMNLVLELVDGALAPVVFGDDFPQTCFNLAVALDSSVMWSTGAKDVLSFDGTTWTRID